MNYPIEQLERDIALMVMQDADLRRRKGADYATPEDTFSDLRPLGVDYVAKRLIQKLWRVIHLQSKEPDVIEDSLKSEFQDIRNFALYIEPLYKQIKEKK